MSELVLLKYRLFAFKNYLVDTIKNSPLKLSFSLTFFSIIFLVMHQFFRATYAFFSGFEDLKFDLWFSNTILNGIFFFNLIFITISAAILSYNIIYKDKNTLLLYFSKIPTRAIFWEMFIRTSIISSWSFLVLSVPLFLVQFEQYKIPFFSPYILMSALLVAVFLILPNAIGVSIGLFMPLFLTARRVVKIFLFLAVVATFALLPQIDIFKSGWSSLYSDIWIVQTLKKFAFLEHPLLPSYWITATLNGFFNKAPKQDTIYLLITTSLVFLIWLFITFKISFKNMLIMSTRYIPDKNPIIEGIISFLQRFGGVIGGNARYLFFKDIVIFLRDGRFWGQALLFLGIFALYFINLADSDLQGTPWIWGRGIKWNELILHLNIIASSFMSSALAGRGLFPQFSIEYSKLWINKFSNYNLKNIVQSKLNTIGTLITIISIAVVTTSSIILKTSFVHLAYAIVHCAIFTYTISNMALKLGVLMHNKRSDNPVIIFSGPGGVTYIMSAILFITLNATLMLKIGLLGNQKATWLTVFISENILVNFLLNRLCEKVYNNIEYT